MFQALNCVSFKPSQNWTSFPKFGHQKLLKDLGTLSLYYSLKTGPSSNHHIHQRKSWNLFVKEKCQTTWKVGCWCAVESWGCVDEGGGTRPCCWAAAETVAASIPGDICWEAGLVTNSILFCWLFKIKNRCKKVCSQQTHNQGLRQLLLTVSWDLRA